MKIRLTVSFLGTNYHGWQVQANAVTVQQTLGEAVKKITGEEISLTGCSRTDAGVHALSYCCAFSLSKETDLTALCRSLNAVLPDDIAVKDACLVPDDFHPRYSATGKRYLYRIYNAPYFDPFERGRALYRREPLRLDIMREAAKCLIGTHDFAAFMAAGSAITDTVRTVTQFDIEKEGNLVTLRVAADGFLYNMVRIFVGTLLYVSEGKLAAENLPAIIDSKNRGEAGPTAPPEGLYLEEVFYENGKECPPCNL